MRFRLIMSLVSALVLTAASLMAADGPTLKEAEAEADRLDPGWRLADLEAKRAKVPPEKDGAALVLKVFRAMPEVWKVFPKTATSPKPDADRSAEAALTAAIADDPTRPIPPDVIAPLMAEQAELGATLAEARGLEKYQTGRYPLVFSPNPVATPLLHLNDARSVARLLSFDGRLLALTGDADGALASARAILGVARSIGDEPSAISQLVRMAIEAVAIEVIEQALARGTPSDAALAATQASLAEEAAQPLLVHAIRGERAMIFDVTDKIASGKIDIKEFAGPLYDLRAAEMHAMIRGDQALALHRFNLAVEASKKPLPDQPALWDRLEDDRKRATPSERDRYNRVYSIMPAFVPLSHAYLRTRSVLRAAETMVGLERVRRATGHWPKPGESLAPAFKDVPPADPFTGKPMRWKATPNGLVVYSVGYDRGDHGGNLENKNVRRPGTDIGFRLWDVDRRPAPSKPR